MRNFKFPILCTILILIWSVFTFRFEVLFLLFLVLFVALSKKYRKNFRVFVLIVTLALLVPFSPIGISFIGKPGSPRVIGYCKIPVPFRSKEEAATAFGLEGEGKCIVASDLITGFEPKKFIGW